MKNRKIWMLVLCCAAVTFGSAVSANEWVENEWTGNEWSEVGEAQVDQIPEQAPPMDAAPGDAFQSGEETMNTGHTSNQEQVWTTETGENLVGVSPSTEWETETGHYYPVEQESTLLDGYIILRKDAAADAFTLFSESQLPETMYLDVPEVIQNPELPTGCESVALTMALMYEGFELEKTTIARDYLLYNREDDNMAVGYIGDPFSDSGAGCFAPALAATAMAYLEEMDSDYLVYDMTGSSLDELLSYVAIGRPVIIWGSMYMMEPQFTGETAFFAGVEYRWYGSEHCMVLSGYDLKSQTVVINDPLEGIVTRDLAEFERIFDLTGQNAMVLQKNEANTVS